MGLVGGLWIAAWFAAPLAAAWILRRRSRGATRFGVGCAGIATTAYAAAFTHAILSNTSSTAGIAFLALPFLLVPAFAISWLAGWSIGVFVARDPAAPRSRQRTAVAVAILSWALFGAYSVGRFVAHERRAADPGATPDDLRRVLVFRDEHPRSYAFASALLMRDGNTLPLARVAVHPAAPEDVLATLARDPDASVAWRAVANPRLGTEALRRLAREGGDADRARVVANPNAPVELLVELAEDPEPGLALELARHPALPDAMRERLFERAITSGDVHVRNLAAVQPKLSPRLVEQLAHDTEPLVRRSAAANGNLPAAALAALAADPDPDVRRMAEHMAQERATRAPDPAAAASP